MSSVAVARSDRVSLRLGLRDNAGQFTLLVIVNAFVGAMVGMERSILPALAAADFHVAARTAMLSFIAVFGVSKALTNYAAGRAADRMGRRRLLLAGWITAAPVPFMLIAAPTWTWVVAANALLGVSQGLTWSMTVIMKIDLVGPQRRGLAMGINECTGYLAVAAAAFATGWIASRTSLRPEPFYLGIAFVAAGLLLSIFARETHGHAALESNRLGATGVVPRSVFWHTTALDPDLSSASQAGFVNNLNDGMAWGLFPLIFAAAGNGLAAIGVLAAIYPATWGVVQLGTGALSDRLGRRPLIAGGMWVQAAGIVIVGAGHAFWTFAAGGVVLGVGTAMVYPTLLAAVSDRAQPAWRASAIGVYRLWRDLGYAAGAIVTGIVADLLGVSAALWIVAALTFGSGIVVAARMTGHKSG